MAGLIPPRASADACPGVLRPHHAADGDLVRLRLPGGAVSAGALLALASASASFGDGRLGLTSRANLQVRGVSPAAVDRLAGAARAAGLLPSLTHERVRNIVASPMSGRLASSRAPVDALVADLDAALCLRPGLADLPGRFLFAVDDGTGDVAGLGADVLLQAQGDGLFAVRIGAGSFVADSFVADSFVVPDSFVADSFVMTELDAVSAALAVAEAFLAERSSAGHQAWRIAELPDGPARILAAVAPTFASPVFADHGEKCAAQANSGADHEGKSMISAGGLVEQGDGRVGVCVVVPLGVLSAVQVDAVAAAGALSSSPDPLRITPWRRIVVRDLEVPAALAARELLSAYGLVVDGATAWNRVTACAGRPGCAQALADVHADARAFVAAAAGSLGAAGGGPPAAAAGLSAASALGTPLHWAGCERGCGTPAGPVAVAVATGRGYQLRGGGELDAAEQAWIGAR